MYSYSYVQFSIPYFFTAFLLLLSFYLVCRYLLGDMLDMNLRDWTDADVVFMNSTCYDDALIKKITAISGKILTE